MILFGRWHVSLQLLIKDIVSWTISESIAFLVRNRLLLNVVLNVIAVNLTVTSGSLESLILGKRYRGDTISEGIY
jgi:hypothetical protein